MKKEIIDWYSDNHYNPYKLVRIGENRLGLSEPKVLAAMEHCYYKIHNGKKVQMIDVARYVFNVARDIKSEDYEKKIDFLKNAENEIKTSRRNMYISWSLSVVFNILFWAFLLNWN